MEYTVVKSDHIARISDIVNAAIREGWVPQGGPCVVGGFVGQALIRGGRMMGGSRKNRNRKNRTRKHRQ